MKTKALTVIVLLIFLVITTVYYIPTYASAKLNAVTAGTPVNLGAPVPTRAHTLNSAVTKQGSTNILCTISSGSPSILNIVNIENPDSCKVLETYEVTTGDVWANVVDSKGNYYFAGFLDGTRLYKYSPNNPEGQRLQTLGSSVKGAVTAMTVDNEDNVYFTNSRTGDIMKWDIKTSSFVNYGRLLTFPEYARSLVYYNGYLYGGGQTDGAKFFRFNLSTRQMEYITNSPTPSNAVIKSYYTMKIVGKYLFAYMETGGGNIMSIYDLEGKKWIKYDSSSGLYPTGDIDGYVYYASTGPKGQPIKKFSLATTEITDANVSALPNYGLRGAGIANLTANPKYSGKMFVMVYATSGDLMFINFATGDRQRVYNVISGGNIEIQNFSFLGDDYYSSAYMGAGFSRVNIKTGVSQTHAMGQCEGMMPYKGKLYTGVYPGAKVFEYDPATNTSKQLFSVGRYQDRPFQIKAFDDKLFIGTISDYGLLGGALTVYDLKTKTQSVHKDIVKDQSITGIAYKDGKIYGSTCISGGLGSAPTQSRAKLFIYNVGTKTKTKEVTPTFKSASTVTHIGELCFAPDGKLWGTAGGIIFEINPNTLEIISETRVSTGGTFGSWRPVYIFFDSSGIMYANPGGNLVAFDPNTKEYKNIAPNAAGKVVFFTMNEARNIIIFNNSSFKAQAFRLDVTNKYVPGTQTATPGTTNNTISNDVNNTNKTFRTARPGSSSDTDIIFQSGVSPVSGDIAQSVGPLNPDDPAINNTGDRWQGDPNASAINNSGDLQGNKTGGQDTLYDGTGNMLDNLSEGMASNIGSESAVSGSHKNNNTDATDSGNTMTAIIIALITAGAVIGGVTGAIVLIKNKR